MSTRKPNPQDVHPGQETTRTGRSRIRYAAFETPLGCCGISWSERGIVRIQLPEANKDDTIRRLMNGRHLAEAQPPPWVAQAIRGIARHLRGEIQDFSRLPLDMTGIAPFRERVYQAARGIPPGRTITYGELATLVGARGAARAVGRAMATNPFGIVVPCHRVVASRGKIGGFSAYGGPDTKARLLTIEGVRAAPPRLPLFDGTDEPDSYTMRAVRHLRGADPKLAAVIDQVGRFRLELRHTHSSFGALAEAIIYQQLTGKAAASILGRVKALYAGRRFPSPQDVLATADVSLRRAGLSGSKLLALKDLARKVLDGTVPPIAKLRQLRDEEIIDRLTSVHGVGRWTVEMLLIFRLGRPDVLPIDDYGLRKGFAIVFGRPDVPTPREVAARGERWRPYRTVASWYLWRAADRFTARPSDP